MLFSPLLPVFRHSACWSGDIQLNQRHSRTRQRVKSRAHESLYGNYSNLWSLSQFSVSLPNSNWVDDNSTMFNNLKPRFAQFDILFLTTTRSLSPLYSIRRPPYHEARLGAIWDFYLLEWHHPQLKFKSWFIVPRRNRRIYLISKQTPGKFEYFRRKSFIRGAIFTASKLKSVRKVLMENAR